MRRARLSSPRLASGERTSAPTRDKTTTRRDSVVNIRRTFILSTSTRRALALLRRLLPSRDLTRRRATRARPPGLARGPIAVVRATLEVARPPLALSRPRRVRLQLRRRRLFLLAAPDASSLLSSSRRRGVGLCPAHRRFFVAPAWQIIITAPRPTVLSGAGARPSDLPDHLSREERLRLRHAPSGGPVTSTSAHVELASGGCARVAPHTLGAVSSAREIDLREGARAEPEDDERGDARVEGPCAGEPRALRSVAWARRSVAASSRHRARARLRAPGQETLVILILLAAFSRRSHAFASRCTRLSYSKSNRPSAIKRYSASVRERVKRSGRFDA